MLTVRIDGESAHISNSFNVYQVNVGRYKGKKWVPTQALGE